MQETSMVRQCLHNKTKVGWNFVLLLYEATKGKRNLHYSAGLFFFIIFLQKKKITNELSIDLVK